MTGKLDINIVEDDTLTLAALKRIIYTMGHRVCGSADNYDQAVCDLSILTTDLILTDIMIRGSKTGIDLAGYINKHLHLPFIIQSSVTSDDILVDARNTYPTALLQKPVSISALHFALERLPH